MNFSANEWWEGTQNCSSQIERKALIRVSVSVMEDRAKAVHLKEIETFFACRRRLDLGPTRPQCRFG